MSQSIAYKHYLRALSRWPKDPLRPDCQFQDAMRRSIERKFNPTSASTTDPKTSPATPVVNEKAELEQVNALYSLMYNRYRQRYPLTGSLMKPASNPDHYTNLIKELDAAPTRSWLDRTINRWKGALRFK